MWRQQLPYRNVIHDQLMMKVFCRCSENVIVWYK